MKEKIKQLCIWYLSKYYKPTLNRISINDDINFTIDGYLKDTEDWQHCAFSVTSWIKAEKANPMFANIAYYNNGHKVREYSIDERGEEYWL